MESPLVADSDKIKNGDHFTAFKGDHQQRKQRPVLRSFDCKNAWDGLYKQLTDCIQYKDFFQSSQHIYENRINNDVNYLDIMDAPEEIRSGFRYLQSRYNELHNSVTELETDVKNCIRKVKKLKRYGFRRISSAEKRLLSSMFNIFCESKYLRENFQDHQFDYIDNLVVLDEQLGEVDDIDVLKKMYTYLNKRFVELQKYSLIQESKIDECKNLMDGLFGVIEKEKKGTDRVVHSSEPKNRAVHSPKAKDGVVHSPKQKDRIAQSPEHKGRVVHTSESKDQVVHSPVLKDQAVHSDVPKGRVIHSAVPKCRVVHSPVYHRRTPVQVEQRKVTSQEHALRYTPVDHQEVVLEQNVTPLQSRSSFSDPEDYYESEIEEEQPYFNDRHIVQKPQRAVMPEYVAAKRLQPIPTHIYSQSRVAPESKCNVFNERVKSYSNIGSTGYGNSKPRHSEFNNAIVLPPVQSKAVKYLPNAPETQQSMHSEYAIKRASIKGIVKPSLLNKDVLRLRDPSVRVRGASKQHLAHQELNKTPILPSIHRQKDPAKIDAQLYQSGIGRNQGAILQDQVASTAILPKIPQPPSQPKQQGFTSRIPLLPSIQQQSQSTPSRIPQPPKGERLRDAKFQRRIARFQ